MRIAELWRYPVKSMAGERLERAEVREDGIVGDRGVHVEDARGRVITSRSEPWLLGHHATLGADGEPLVDGRPWDEVALPDGFRLVRFDGLERFDVLPLLVATDGAVAALGYDGRRLRPNVVIGGVPGLAEREWEGRALRMGDALIGVQKLRQRCIMTTFDPDTQAQDVEVLKTIHRRFAGKIALNCYVVRAGVVRVGDAVELVD